MGGTIREATVKLDAETVRTLLVRYLPLLEHLEMGSGYETVMVQFHGKRPVKMWRISAPQVLEMLQEADANEIITIV